MPSAKFVFDTEMSIDRLIDKYVINICKFSILNLYFSCFHSIFSPSPICIGVFKPTTLKIMENNQSIYFFQCISSIWMIDVNQTNKTKTIWLVQKHSFVILPNRFDKNRLHLKLVGVHCNWQRIYCQLLLYL